MQINEEYKNQLIQEWKTFKSFDLFGLIFFLFFLVIAVLVIVCWWWYQDDKVTKQRYESYFSQQEKYFIHAGEYPYSLWKSFDEEEGQEILHPNFDNIIRE